LKFATPMETPRQYIITLFNTWKSLGILSVVYALLAEALLIGYVTFAGLFTIETILPTFISVRLSLTAFLALLFISSFLLAILGRFLDLDFTSGLRRRNPLLSIGILWMTSILALSLYKFPLFLIPILILAFLGIGFLFLSLFFKKNG
jgi:hypothetical protein